MNAKATTRQLATHERELRGWRISHPHQHSSVGGPWSRGHVVFPFSAFTLTELLIVIGIMGILAAITIPALNQINKGDATISATRRLLADVAHARQLAISRRTTVFMVFVPTNFWNYNDYVSLPPTERNKGLQIYDKQLTGYALVTLREVGDQPGRNTARYLTEWRALPEGSFIPTDKFNTSVIINDPPLPALPTLRSFPVNIFSTTNIIPFPSEDAAQFASRFVPLPYIAFNYLGQLTKDGVNPSRQDEYIPLAKGSVMHAHDANKVPQAQVPDISEVPVGNSSNSFNLIHIDWLTGRARLERQEIGGS